MEQFPLLIAGARSTGTFAEVRSPYSGKVVASVERTDAAALEQALVNAHSCFYSEMKDMPAYRRAEILYSVAEQIDVATEELAQTIALEGGKPLKDARAEVRRARITTKMSGDAALEMNGEQISMDRAAGSEHHIAFTLREPLGPVLAISAFNHPVNLICHQVCPAIAAGNTVVVKPASQTPVSCLKIASFFRKAGLPEAALSVTTASGSDAETLVQDPRIRFITFIGGEDVGWGIRKKMQPGVRLALEHGGTAAAIIDRDVDLKAVLPSVVRGAFYHAGQVCISTQIVYVDERVAEQFIEALLPAVEKLVVGDPSDEKTDVGPLISMKDVERVDSWVAEAVSAGAVVRAGGKALDNHCYAPTVLTDVNEEMKVMSKEIFGPVLCVSTYTDIDQVVSQMNKTPYSFQAALYSKNIDFAYSQARKIETKACIINDSTAFRVDWMPFGGSKHSGLGVGGIRYAIEDMSEEKLIVTKVRSD